MRRDPTEFRKRFALYKEGKNPYENGLPKFESGRNPYEDSTDFITRFEGWSDTAYLKKGDVPTIGYGTTNPKYVKLGKITRKQGRQAMMEDLATNEPLLLLNIKDYDKLPDSAKTVLRDILYNVGLGNLFRKSPKFIAALNSGNYEEAARQMDWDNNKVGFGGAKKRNTARQKLFLLDLTNHNMIVPRKSELVLQLEEKQLFQPWSNYHATDYPLNNPAPESISSWNSPSSPTYNASGLYLRRANENIHNMILNILSGNEWKPAIGFKDGKLPRYKGGLIPYTSSDGTLYNINPNVVGSELLNITTPEIVVAGKDRRPLYQRYDAEHSTYDPNAIRSITDWTPIVGDVGQGLDAYNAFKSQDYLQAGLLGGMLLLPNAIENGGRMLYRGLRKIGAPRWFVHDIVSDPKRVFKDWYSGDYAFTNKGRSNMLLRDNLRLNALAEDIKQNVISDELLQRKKRVEFAKRKGILTDIMTDVPKDKGITYTYNTQFDPNKILGLSTNPIEIAYYEHPVSSRFKYKWDKYDGHELPITVGHEFVHKLENDYMFSPHFKTSSSAYGNTGYNVPAEGLELITNGAFHMPSARSLMDISEVRSAFSPSISRYNSNLNRIAEANKLGSKEIDFSTHPWHSSPAEVVADLRGAIAAGMDEESIYKFMYDKHLYDGDKVRELRNIGFKDGKSPIHIKPLNRGKLTRLKKRTGKSESELYNDGNPAHKKMVVFARNARKWKH